MSRRISGSAEHKHKPHIDSIDSCRDAFDLHIQSSKQYLYICKSCGRPLSPPTFAVSDKYIAWSNLIAACLFAAVIVCMDWDLVYTLVDRRRIAIIASIISFAVTCVIIALVDTVTCLGGKWDAIGIETGRQTKQYDIISQKQIFSSYASAYRQKLANSIRAILLSHFSFYLGKYTIVPFSIIILLTTIYCIRSSKWKLLSISVLFIISAILLIITPDDLWVFVFLLPGILTSIWISIIIQEKSNE